MQRIQNSQVVARAVAVLAMLIPIGGCAPLFHFIHYHPPASAMADKHRTYFHSSHTGRIIPKDGCYTYCEPGCFGYEPTCWQPWPAECPNCPVQQQEVVVSERVISGEVIHEHPVAPLSEPVMTEPHVQPAQPQPPRPANAEGANVPQMPQAPAVPHAVMASTPPQTATNSEPIQQRRLVQSTPDPTEFALDHDVAGVHGPEADASAPPREVRTEIDEPVSSRRRREQPDTTKTADSDIETPEMPQPAPTTEPATDDASETVVDAIVAQPPTSSSDSEVATELSETAAELSDAEPELREPEAVASLDAPTVLPSVDIPVDTTVPSIEPFVVVSQSDPAVSKSDTSLTQKEAPARESAKLDQTSELRIVADTEKSASPTASVIGGFSPSKVESRAKGATKERLPLRVSSLPKPMIRFAKKTGRTAVRVDSTSGSKSSATLRFRD